MANKAARSQPRNQAAVASGEQWRSHGWQEALSLASRRAEGVELQPHEVNQADEAERRIKAWEDVVRQAGPRYANCGLDRFDRYDPRQESVLASVMDFSDRLAERLDQGANLILFGPPGTGKDHLMMALLRQAVLGFGARVAWRNGADLFGQVRDRIGENESEGPLINDLAAPQVLALSDPVPPFGGLSNFQAQFLFRIIDRRYRLKKCTWATMNVESGDEARTRMGAAVVDRLRELGLACFCEWGSFRDRKQLQ